MRVMWYSYGNEYILRNEKEKILWNIHIARVKCDLLVSPEKRDGEVTDHNLPISGG